MSWDGFLSEKLRSKQYTQKNDAKKDIMRTLRAYPDLHPEEDTYVHNDGITQHLICLKGTIPVNYKGSMYNIPMQILLMSGHPLKPPLVFVRPTSSMVVRPSKHVDQAGRVYLPYLTSWNPDSDTKGMIAVLQAIFGQECPVYAKPANPAPPRPNPPPAYQYVGPGYPKQSTNMPMPGMPSTSYGSGYPLHPSYPAPTNSPYPTSQTSTPYPTMTSYQPARPSPTNGAVRPPQRQGSIIPDDTLRASLLSTAEDKLKRRVKEVFEMGKMEIQTLQTTKSDLEQGNRELTDMLNRMKDEKENLTSNVSLLRQKNNEVEDVLQKLEADSENMNIDEAVVTTAPLYNQILTLFAEENAVEDALYYLSGALNKEVIQLEAYLKAVRMLSRKQFLLRAQLQKARDTAGLSFSVLGH